MPQTFHVLLCVVCKTFQVQIVKKSSNKWNCKVCDSKQSVQQVYAKGTAPECRDIVQRLNAARGKREEELDSKSLAQAEQEDCTDFSSGRDEDHYDKETSTFTSEYSESQIPTTLPNNNRKLGILTVPPEQSKWTVFLDDN